MKKQINTEKAPGAIGPYSQGIVAGDFIFVSGQTPLVPGTTDFPKPIPDQARQSLLNVQAILESAGSSLDKVVKTTVFISDMAHFAEVNKVYAEFFKEPFPARSCFAVKQLPLGIDVEIEVIALK